MFEFSAALPLESTYRAASKSKAQTTKACLLLKIYEKEILVSLAIPILTDLHVY